MMAAVILFIVICIGLYFLYQYMRKESEKADHYRELATFFSERELGLVRTDRHKKENPDDVICRFFKEHPDKLVEAEKRYKEEKEREHNNLESWKKLYIMQRTFAYDYEDMLFQIYSKVATEDTRGKWVAITHVKKEDLISNISEIKNIDSAEAERLLNSLHKHCILSDVGDGCLLSSLLQDLGTDEKWAWNIVSDTDQNLDKWMVAHGYEHKNE